MFAAALLRGERRDVGVHDRLPGPNLVRSLFADAAIQAAFVPIFTEHLERGNKREAFRLASTLIFLVTLVLTALTALFILIAPVLMPLFVGSDVPQGLTVTLAQVLFPILVMLGATGMVVGILNSYNRFGAFAISPFFWNVAIIAVLVGLAPLFHGDAAGLPVARHHLAALRGSRR